MLEGNLNVRIDVNVLRHLEFFKEKNGKEAKKWDRRREEGEGGRDIGETKERK